MADIELSKEWKEFEKSVRELIGEFDDLVEKEVYQLGLIYKAELQEQITNVGAVDTGNMRDKVAVVRVSPFVCEVGSIAEYTRYVNDGHRQSKRFVPGHFRAKGGFQYMPYPQNNGQGMMLKERWVEGKKFFEKTQVSVEPKLKRELSLFMTAIKRELNL